MVKSEKSIHWLQMPDTEQAITKLRELFASVLKGHHEEDLLLFDAIMESGLRTGAVSNDELRTFVRDSMASGQTEFLDLLLKHFSEERIFSESVSVLSRGFKKQFFCAMLDEGYFSVEPALSTGSIIDLHVITASGQIIEYKDLIYEKTPFEVLEEHYKQLTTIPSFDEYILHQTKDWPYLAETPITRDNFIRAHMFGHLEAWMDSIGERLSMDDIYHMLDDLPQHIHDQCHRLLDIPPMSHAIASAKRPHPIGEWTAAVGAQPERRAAR